MRKALKDLVVLDFTHWIAGAFATYLLGQLGAYIIKIERPYVGDHFRLYPPFYNNESLGFTACNMNKHSLCMDLRSERAKEIIKNLLLHVDIVAQNFRAGTIEKMGLGWDVIHKINPRIIMANNSGFGQDGPYSTRVAFDSIIQSESGLISSVAEYSDGIPFYPGGNNSDHTGALNFACAILAAVNQRNRTGKGQYLEVDMMSSVTSMFSPELSLYGATGKHVKANDFSPCGYYRDRSGKYVHISCPSHHWEDLKEIMDIEALSSANFNSHEKRLVNKKKLDELIEGWTSMRDGEELCATLEAKGIGAAVVRQYKDVLENEHAKAIGYFKKVEVPYVGEAIYPDVPFRLSNSPIEFNRAPKIGEHNTVILRKFLGMDDSEIERLTSDGVLYQAEHATYPPR